MDYKVDLEVFNGPMDLLLYLISREEVDIHEISISRIVDQYLAYLDHLRDLNVDITSDFIVMASTLILIKSKALLPTEEIDLDEDLDQQDELIQHLLEYKKVKILSRALDEVGKYHSLRYPRPAHPGAPVEDDAFSHDEVNLWDLLRAFAEIVKQTGLDRRFHVVHSEKPISDYISVILEKLEAQQSLSFDALFTGERSRNEAICNFISLLELIRRKFVKVHMDGQNGSTLQITLMLDQEALDALKINGRFCLEELLGSIEEEEQPSSAPEPAPDQDIVAHEPQSAPPPEEVAPSEKVATPQKIAAPEEVASADASDVAAMDGAV